MENNENNGNINQPEFVDDEEIIINPRPRQRIVQANQGQPPRGLAFEIHENIENQ
jgi:hypothetical protein